MKRTFTGWMTRFLAFVAVALVFAFPATAAQQSVVSLVEVLAQQVPGPSPGTWVFGLNTPNESSVITVCNYINPAHPVTGAARVSAGDDAGQASGARVYKALLMTSEVVIGTSRTRR